MAIGLPNPAGITDADLVDPRAPAYMAPREMTAEELMNLRRSIAEGSVIGGRAQQVQGLRDMEFLRNQLLSQPSQLDLSPTAGLIDTLTKGKTNLQQRYEKPMSAEERQALLSKIQQGIQSEYSKLSENDIKTLAAHLGIAGVKVKAETQLKVAETQGGAKVDAAKVAAEASTKKGEGKPTPAQIGTDKDMGKRVNDWQTGGSREADNAIAGLDRAVATLQTNPKLTGPKAAITPWKSVTDPELQGLVDLVQEQAMGSLRATLGAQFTENEGKRILGLAINPDLPVSENLFRIQRKVALLKARRDDMARATKYYQENNGSMSGYKFYDETVDDGTKTTGAPKYEYNPKLNKTRITHPDGTQEFKDGRVDPPAR